MPATAGLAHDHHDEPTTPDAMNATTYDRYGGPEVLEYRSAETPTVGDGEALLSVHATSVNAGDIHLMRGSPFLVRFIYGGLRKPDRSILGMDVAGTVAAVGDGVTAFEPGDAVVADVSECEEGGFAEYVVVPVESLVAKPPDVSFEDAASVPTAAVTALQAVRDEGRLQSGEHVLVNGASGGVGTFAVQLAKSFGAEVTGVCSTETVDLVHSIGADHVVDYTRTALTDTDERYDLIVDAAAAHSLRAYRRLLRPGGRYVMVGGPVRRFLTTTIFGPVLSRIGSPSLGAFEMDPNADDLATVLDGVADGTITPAIDRTYPLAETATAVADLEAGHVRGKFVVTTHDGEG